tara:strand:- start:729 stop:1082 length:354 start_codon:yes stop_codon:yes gene_type:complete
MSDQLSSFNSPIKKEVVEEIETLDLSTLQKLHLKLLIHCLEIFKSIISEAENDFPSEIQINNWCKNESQKLNDSNFSPLLFQQMNAAAKKLQSHAKNINKNALTLTLEDLILLVSKD